MSTLSVGDPAPDFTLPSHDGARFAMTDHRGRWIVVYFYPKDFTPGCTKEACGFRDRYDEFQNAGATVVGISSDTIETHERFVDKHNLPFPLLSDPDDTVRSAYDVGKSMGVLPGRVSFVIDPEGIVRRVFSAQFRAVRHVAEALDAIRESS